MKRDIRLRGVLFCVIISAVLIVAPLAKGQVAPVQGNTPKTIYVNMTGHCLAFTCVNFGAVSLPKWR
jgi:5-enolpyruvylshikimate-3-phosphate synthase